MFTNKQKPLAKLKNKLEIFYLSIRLFSPDERLIALYLKRKVRTLQGYSAR